jgi:dipeptidyl-peptidase-4
MRNLYLVVLLLTTTTLIAQKKPLTLQESVMGQWRQFYPKQPANLQWVPGKQQFSFMNENRSAILLQEASKKTAVKAIDREMLEDATGLELNYLPGIKWTTAESFDFTYDKTTYFMQWNDNKVVLLSKVVIPIGGHHDWHKETKQIAYTQNNNLYIQNPLGGKVEVFYSKNKDIVTGQAIARYEFGIKKGTFWSPDGSKLAFYQKDETDVATYPLLDISTTPATLNPIKYPMTGQQSEYAKVGVFDGATKEVIFLNVEGEKDQYLTNVGWGPDNKYLYVAVVNRAQNRMWLNQYDATTGDFVKTLIKEEHDRYVEPEHAVWFLPNNKNEFLWQSERDGFNHLYRYNTEGKLLGQVTKGNWVVLDILGLDDKGKSVLVKGTDESGLNTTLYKTSLDGKKNPTRIITKEGQHSIKLSSNKKFILDGYSDLETPFVWRLLNSKGKEQQVISTAADPYTDRVVGTTTFKTLKAKDGTPLHTRLIKPADFDPAKKYPVIVYVYGGPHAQMITNSWLGNASLWMHYAANQGYLVFTLDNRGSANRGFEFESCIHRNLSDLEMQDQMVGVDYLKTLSYADTDRMAVHGWSYGGFMTTSMMLKYPDVFKVGVAGGPVTNWNYYEVMYGERYMDSPEENPEGYEKTTLSNHADKLEGDLLLIHGTIDDVVVMQHNFSLVKAFVDNGILVDFFPYPMHPHNVRGKDRVHLINKVLTYIDEKLDK